MCSLTWHSLPQLLGTAGSSGRVKGGGQALWLCGFVALFFCLATVAARPQLLHLCLLSSWVTRFSCLYWITQARKLFLPFCSSWLQKLTARCKLILLLSWETHSELWSVFVAPISALFPSFLPYLSELTHLQMFQCVNLSDVFVCWERNLWLNYSCLACNFNGWDKGHPLCCHASDVTDYF